MRGWLADLLIPIVALTRYGFCAGWVDRTHGVRFAHIETLFLRPKYRASAGAPDVWKFEVHAAFIRACERRGIHCLVTRVAKKRTHLQAMIQRLGGYVKYGDDLTCTWSRLDLRSPAARAALHERHADARRRSKGA